jgi:hypothetical protein
MEDQVHGAREHNCPLISEFFHVGYCGNNLVVFNIVHRFRILIYLSNISKCDGITLNEFVVSDCSKILHLHVFPREEPLAANFRQWHDVIRQLCAGTATIPALLGRLICPPHIACR